LSRIMSSWIVFKTIVGRSIVVVLFLRVITCFTFAWSIRVIANDRTTHTNQITYKIELIRFIVHNVFLHQTIKRICVELICRARCIVQLRVVICRVWLRAIARDAGTSRNRVCERANVCVDRSRARLRALIDYVSQCQRTSRNFVFFFSICAHRSFDAISINDKTRKNVKNHTWIDVSQHALTLMRIITRKCASKRQIMRMWSRHV
jgi:hypothetical protein